MRQRVTESFAPFAQRIAASRAQGDLRLLGTSGTVTTLASLHLGLPHYDRRAVDGLIVPAQSMHDISARLSRSEEHTSELQSLMRLSYAVFCLKKKKIKI